MRISYTPEQEELRRELRSYFAKLMTPERQEALFSTSGGEIGTGNVYRETVAQMGKDGWLTLSWPTEYGGQARSPMEGLIFTDEAAIAGAPVPFLTINSVAPTIMAYGTDEQKKFFLPKIAAGDLHFSIGYSEPDAGTDLASLRTRAKRTPDGYVVNGQKMWTSLIPYADYVKIDVRDLDRIGPELLELARRHGALLVAERVCDQEIVARCRALGFELFQGDALGPAVTLVA